MKKIIYIKFGELYLKGNNINFFKDRLVTNLQKALIGFKFHLKVNYDALVIDEFDDEKINLITMIISKIPGFSHYSIGYHLDFNLDELYDLVNKMLINTKTFKIEVKRSNKKYEYNSDQLKRMIATNVLNKISNIKVDLHNPEKKIFIEVKNNGFIVYANKVYCTKGLPVGTSGRTLMLLSGGIDSPVASHMLMCRGMHVDFLVFVTPPFTENELINKIKTLVKDITLNYRLENPKIYLCNFTNIQNELSHIDKESYRITLLRRSFVRIANMVCEYQNYDCLATGDSLGQVASQTIESINVINEASNKLILRPLITYNKEMIIDYAKTINTYKTSIIPLSDTCSLFAPKNPVTKPKLDIAQKLENSIILLKELEKSALMNIEVITYDKK